MKKFISIYLILLLFSFSACKKFLDKKGDVSFAFPETVQHLQGLLDEQRFNQSDPSFGERSADDHYVTQIDYNMLSENERATYTWEKVIPNVDMVIEWKLANLQVLKANLVLDNIDKIERQPNDSLAWNNAKGHAYFLRARISLNVVTTWALAYDQQTAASELGIPLRL